MSYLSVVYPEYDCDEFGNIYRSGNIIKPFKSNKYYQVCLYDSNHTKKVVGVHTVMAMKYLDYYDGCVVHHIDEDAHNNAKNNLEVMSKSEHAHLHGLKKEFFKNMNRGKPAWNRGMKMSDEFRKHCSESAKKRCENAKKCRGVVDRVDTDGFDPSEIGSIPIALV